MDVIIRHWVGLMVDNEAGPDGFGYTVADKMTLFYAYYGIIDSTNMVWLQWVFDILIGLFEWFGVRTYMEKIVTMVCQSGPIATQQSNVAYGWRMTVEGDPNRVNQLRKLVWQECGGELDVAYMTAQIQMQHIWQGQARPLTHPLPILTKN